jgi:hypothetical protein
MLFTTLYTIALMHKDTGFHCFPLLLLLLLLQNTSMHRYNLNAANIWNAAAWNTLCSHAPQKLQKEQKAHLAGSKSSQITACVYTCVCPGVCVCVCMCVFACVCFCALLPFVLWWDRPRETSTRRHTHKHTHTHTYAHTKTHTYTHTRPCTCADPQMKGRKL